MACGNKDCHNDFLCIISQENYKVIAHITWNYNCYNTNEILKFSTKQEIRQQPRPLGS